MCKGVKLVIDLITNYLLNTENTYKEQIPVNKDSWTIRNNSNLMYKNFIETQKLIEKIKSDYK